MAFTREDEARTVRFAVEPPADAPAGDYRIGARFEAGGERFDRGYQVVEYPHVARRHLVHAAEAAIKVLDVRLDPDLLVGYVDGVGDEVPPAIEQLGARLEHITGDELRFGDLSRYDVIVTGVRAYERNLVLRANNDRLLEYVEAGGTMVVQYNKFEFNDAQYGPYPARVGRGRVTDEYAPVRIVAPDHPVFGYPNAMVERLGAGARALLPRRPGWRTPTAARPVPVHAGRRGGHRASSVLTRLEPGSPGGYVLRFGVEGRPRRPSRATRPLAIVTGVRLYERNLVLRLEQRPAARVRRGGRRPLPPGRQGSGPSSSTTRSTDDFTSTVQSTCWFRRSVRPASVAARTDDGRAGADRRAPDHRCRLSGHLRRLAAAGCRGPTSTDARRRTSGTLAPDHGPRVETSSGRCDRVS